MKKTVSAELKPAVNIKYINIKMKKKLKNNSEILYIIKDAGELCVKMLLFLLCNESLEKIDFEFMKSIVKTKKSGEPKDDEIVEAVDFWKSKNILDYEITSSPNIKGANMDNILSIILKISSDINIMSEDGTVGDSGELDAGLGIYDRKYKIEKIEKSEIIEPEIIVAEEYTDDIDETEYTEYTEDIDEEVPETVETEIETEIEKETPVNLPGREQPSAEAVAISIDELCESLETNNGFRKLVHEAQEKMRTIFNTEKLTVMYNLYGREKIESSLILKYIEEFVKDEKDSLRYIETVALGNAANGISTLSQYEEKTRKLRAMIEFEDKIKKLFGAEDIKLKPKEKKYIKEWQEYGFSDDMLLEGYKRGMKNTEALSISYINSIYSNWHAKGFKTFEEVMNEFVTLPEGFDNGRKKKTMGLDVDKLLEKRIRKKLKF